MQLAKIQSSEITRPLVDLAVLPNGQPLRYALCFDRGNHTQWFRTHDAAAVREHASAVEKRKLPKLALWSAVGNQHVVCADIDQLPRGFRSYDELYAALSTRFAGAAAVFRSPSGKVKALFAVELLPGVRMSTAIALATLEHVLPANVFAACDCTASSLFQTFLNPEAIEALRGLKLLKLTQPVYCDGDQAEIPRKAMRRFKGPLPRALRSFCNGGKGVHKREAFLRLLLASPMLAYDGGFALPTKFLSAELGVSPQSIASWRDALANAGLLEVTSADYVPGKSARRYRAIGVLLTELLKIRAARPVSLPQRLPTQIADGTWYRTLWQVSTHFTWRPEAFLAWVQTLPGWDTKDRWRLAVNAINSRLERREHLPKVAA